MGKIYKVTALIFFILCLIFFTSQNSLAANTTMIFSPSTGTYDKAFSVSLVINGNGDKFNAVQATVSLSNNLAIQDLTYGDCNFSFLKTPSIQNPTFEGIIPGSYSTKCAVFTMTLIPIAKGTGSINISKATVRRYGDAAEVLSLTQNGSYTLSAAISAPTSMQLKNTSKTDLYTLYFKVSSSNLTPVSKASVILNQISSKSQTQGTTGNSGVAHFSNLVQGLYDVVIKEDVNKVGEEVINVTGSNNVLSLGINLTTQKSNPLMRKPSLLNSISSNPLFIIGILIIGIILGVVVAVVVLKLLGKKGDKLLNL